MPDNKYCYPETDVLINKLNISDAGQLFEAEKELTAIRLRELQDNPIAGKYDSLILKQFINTFSRMSIHGQVKYVQ